MKKTIYRAGFIACVLGWALVGCSDFADGPAARRVQTDPDFYTPFLISQAIQARNLLFLSGQAAINDAGDVVGAWSPNALRRLATSILDRQPPQNTG